MSTLGPWKERSFGASPRWAERPWIWDRRREADGWLRRKGARDAVRFYRRLGYIERGEKFVKEGGE